MMAQPPVLEFAGLLRQLQAEARLTQETAFAVHAAHQLAARFPAGQVFLSLQGTPPGSRSRTIDSVRQVLRCQPAPCPLGKGDHGLHGTWLGAFGIGHHARAGQRGGQAGSAAPVLARRHDHVGPVAGDRDQSRGRVWIRSGGPLTTQPGMLLGSS